MSEQSEWSLEEILTLTPLEFEETIAALWTAMGYEVVRGPVGGGDRGIDVLVKTKQEPAITCSIQAKLYNPGHRVGVSEVREYASLAQRSDIDVVIIVTSSSFTKGAEKEAKELKVKLIDGGRLVALFNKYNIPKPVRLAGSGETTSITVPGAYWKPPAEESHVQEKHNFYDRAQPQLNKGEPKQEDNVPLGHIGWGIFLLLIGIGGIGSVADGEASWPYLFLFIPCLLIGIGFVIDYFDKLYAVRKLRIYLSIPDLDARRLVAAGIWGLEEVVQADASSLAALLQLSLSDAILLKERARNILKTQTTDQSKTEAD